jgi:y4mF family transcriptional regulator
MNIRRTDDLGAIVREFRRKGGLTQAALAERLQVSTRWLSQFENGKATAQIGLVIRVLNELGCVLRVAPQSGKGKRRAFSIDEIVDG